VSSKPPPAGPERERAALEFIEDAVDQAADEAEFERMMQQQSPEEVEAELRAAGVDLERAYGKIERAQAEGFAAAGKASATKAGEGSSNVVPIGAARRRSMPAWQIGLAAAAAAAVVISAWQREAIVAYFSPKPVPTQAPVPPVPTAPPEPPEQLAANALRRVAYDDCAKGYFHFCEDELDQAAALDPAGNQTLEVNTARNAIGLAKQGKHGAYVKAPLGPGEVPLRRTPR
jgi:hypothetical protein